MSAAARLYTPDILALATSLAATPFDPAMPLAGHARSPSCGSTLDLSLRIDAEGAIAAVGARAQACAIGQASTALFVQGALRRTGPEIAAQLEAIELWLSGNGSLPDWPEIARLAAARDYPARHGAILLPWRAALNALSPA